MSGGNEADRFVLALLRACADAIVVGAGTLRRERDHIWTPEFVYPEAASEFATLRGAMRKPSHAEVVFVSASGDIDRTAPTFRAGVPVRVVTGKRGAGEIVAEAGDGLIVCEGGPTLLGVFVGERAVDELFLTTAARLAGRSRDTRRPALLEGHAFRPEDSPGASLISLKRNGDFVLSRYRFSATTSRAARG